MLFKGALLLCLFLTIHSGFSQLQNVPQVNILKDADVLTLSEGIGNFSLTLLYHTATATGNHLVMSPVSVWSLMSLLAEGAVGATRRELRVSLRLPKDPTIVRNSCRVIADSLKVNTATVTLETMSAIFTDSIYPVSNEYASLMINAYNTSLIPLDFQKPESLKTINDFVMTATHGKINNIVNGGDLKGSRMLMTNAIFFKGSWSSPFNISDTTKQPFYNDDGVQIGEVNMMYQKSFFPYANLKTLQARVIELPYGSDKKLSMLVVVPHTGVSLKSMFLRFEMVPLDNLFQSLLNATEEYEDDEVECWLPRFKISTDIIMNKPLNDAGIFRLFDPVYAQLSKISNEALYVSRVIHKAEIEVTEEGTTAAAITAAEVANRISASVFKANRPFVYFLVEKNTNTIIFGGIYSVPSLF